MKTYTEFISKVQDDVLTAVKQVQDASLAGFHTVRETAAGYMPGKAPVTGIESMPNPTQVIENAFGFTSQILELQKQYALKVAESMAKAAKEDKIEITHKAAK
jgi:hypothetical protein